LQIVVTFVKTTCVSVHMLMKVP